PPPMGRSLLLLRHPNRLDHHPLHFFSAHQGFHNKGKLHWAEPEKFHHLSALPWRQSLFVGLDAKAFAIGKAPFQGRRSPSGMSLLERQLANRFQFPAMDRGPASPP